MLDGKTNAEILDGANLVTKLLPLMLIRRLYMVMGAMQ